MTKPVDRRAVARSYRERKAERGIYSVSCTTIGERWFGASQDLEKIQNRHWFTLRQGTHPNRALQAAWNRHGEAALEFSLVETLDSELNTLSLPRVLKERHAFWLAETGAKSV